MEWISLFLILGFGALSFYRGMQGISFNRVNLRQELYYALMGLGVIYLLIPQAFWFAPHEIWSPKGWFFEQKEDWLSIFIPISTIQLILSFTKLIYKDEDLIKNPDIMGFPVVLLPRNIREVIPFSIHIAVAVIFEELVFRLVLFYLLFSLFGATGWWIILPSALVFTLGHSYQGLKGLISSFIWGIILGMTYMITLSIWIPIILHLLHNSSIIVFSLRRIKALTKT